MTDYISKGAIISPCGRYRYRLWREWRGTGAPLGEPKSVLFIMLNPSTADGEQDDPTIRRCVGFAKSWGYDRMEVVNLFAWRATSPSDLLAVEHPNCPVGADNQEHIERAAEGADIIICAWGARGASQDQDRTVLGWLDRYGWTKKTHALKLTKAGQPCHPLYLPGDSKPFRFGERP